MRSPLRDLLSALALVLVSIAMPQSAHAEPVVAGEEHCVINVRSEDVLNLRAQPGAQSSALSGLRYGQCGIMVTGACRGEWCPVEDGHHTGWAHQHYLAMISPAMYCVTGVAVNDVLNLRAWPSATSRVLTILTPHQCGIAFLPYAREGWQRVRVGGWEGWVNRSYLSGE